MRRRVRIAVAVGVLCGAVAGAGCAPSVGGDVVLVTVDTLRPDHLSLFGYDRPTTPRLEAWFGTRGVLYERAYSTEANTPASVVSLLSGRLPEAHGIRRFYQRLDGSVPLVSELLPEDYVTAAFVSNMVLTDEALGIASRFDHYDDRVTERESERNVWERAAGETTDAVLRWVRERSSPEAPLFLWVHYIDPHGPYDAPAAWRRTFDAGTVRPIDASRVPEYVRVEGWSDGTRYVDAYDEEIAYVDAEVGRLLDGLDAARGLDDALLLFSADHGESMMEHERWFTHGYHVYEEIVRVPLALRAPGIRSGRRREVASGIDVAPTILHWAGTQPPGAMEDVDLRTGRGLGPERAVFAEASRRRLQWRAVVQGDRKWLAAVKPGSRRVVRSRYYDLARDPEERKPLRWPGAAVSAPRELLTRIREDPDPGGRPRHLIRGERLDGPKARPRLSDEARERLRALGYVDPD